MLEYLSYGNSCQADRQMLFVYIRKGLEIFQKNKCNSFSETFLVRFNTQLAGT